MTVPKRRFDLHPRILTQAEAASYIGKSITWFQTHKQELEVTGFPRPVRVVGGYDRAAVDAWLDSMDSRQTRTVRGHSGAWEGASRG
jgi:predicted DNA-binding transcriptional regulator AlpA